MARITKIVCDSCGQEICSAPFSKVKTLEVFANADGTVSMRAGEIDEEYDVCKNCLLKIHSLLNDSQSNTGAGGSI